MLKIINFFEKKLIIFNILACQNCYFELLWYFIISLIRRLYEKIQTIKLTTTKKKQESFFFKKLL
ncbi:hypothetical protein CV649_06070 [Borreliella burgdorferi]|nr:hypothetical protein CV656_06440 [Borreliella burgdorferi]PRR14889.1 hypothetical protein CV649_06070 [Borreliella burgdorferi]